MTAHERGVVVSKKDRGEIRRKQDMHNIFVPPSLVLSFVLALAALLLNAINPGVAAVVGAAAALIFLGMLAGWGR